MGGILVGLAASCRAARHGADRTQLDIATVAGVGHATISRFENAGGWPLDPDRIVEAYASECGVEARELWRRAIES